jgi:hypothetical protein
MSSLEEVHTLAPRAKLRTVVVPRALLLAAACSGGDQFTEAWSSSCRRDRAGRAAEQRSPSHYSMGLPVARQPHQPCRRRVVRLP